VGMRDTPLSDLVAGDYDLGFDTAESEADAPWFRDRLKNLTEQEYEIIELLADGYTLREVGDFIGVTESRVCQIRGDIRGKFLRSARTDAIVMRGKQLPLYNQSA
jgi:DNA-binding NarL/FixJ family response regulator